MAKQQAFVTLKDHEENFQNKPSCRLINPAKSELDLVSKKIIERINNTIRNKTRVNQWKNSASVIEWFKEIPNITADIHFYLLILIIFTRPHP